MTADMENWKDHILLLSKIKKKCRYIKLDAKASCVLCTLKSNFNIYSLFPSFHSCKTRAGAKKSCSKHLLGLKFCLICMIIKFYGKICRNLLKGYSKIQSWEFICRELWIVRHLSFQYLLCFSTDPIRIFSYSRLSIFSHLRKERFCVVEDHAFG